MVTSNSTYITPIPECETSLFTEMVPRYFHSRTIKSALGCLVYICRRLQIALSGHHYRRLLSIFNDTTDSRFITQDYTQPYEIANLKLGRVIILRRIWYAENQMHYPTYSLELISLLTPDLHMFCLWHRVFCAVRRVAKVLVEDCPWIAYKLCIALVYDMK